MSYRPSPRVEISPTRSVEHCSLRAIVPLPLLLSLSLSLILTLPLSLEHGSPAHRPAVTFGAHRASAPARRPAVACGVRGPRSFSATAGRLDGLLGGCGACLRDASPGGAPHGVVPIETRTLAAQYRVLHARRCANYRANRGPGFSSHAGHEKGRSGDGLPPGPTGRGASHFAGRDSFPGVSLLFQR
jgi:hypothetical protein